MKSNAPLADWPATKASLYSPPAGLCLSTVSKPNQMGVCACSVRPTAIVAPLPTGCAENVGAAEIRLRHTGTVNLLTPLSCLIETPVRARGGCSKTTAPALSKSAGRVGRDHPPGPVPAANAKDKHESYTRATCGSSAEKVRGTVVEGSKNKKMKKDAEESEGT